MFEIISSLTRRARTTNPEIAIVGAGFAGIGMAIRLKQSGIETFTIYERADRVGGTWRDNTYPGAACDVQSHLYSYSFEPNPNWSSMYGKQQEILDYIEHCVDKYDIRPHIRFNAGVVGARFDEATAVWTVDLDDGDRIRANIVITGTGPLNQVVIPDFQGLDKFAGRVFHSAQWDHDYDLDGKRVAVIGTGASAIQIVPAIAEQVASMDLYQRTPAWVLPKGDRTIGPLEQAIYNRFPVTQRMFRNLIYWLNEARAVGFVVDPRLMKLFRNLALRYLEDAVPDPQLRAQVTPDYTIGCKRVLISNDYYPALCRDNVHVLDTGIRKFTKTGIVGDDGKRRPVDAVIMCTGFKASEDILQFDVIGRNGHNLKDVWADGPESYLGTTIPGFPNFFTIVGANTGLGHSSVVFIIEAQVQYIMSCLKEMRRKGADWMDVRQDVHDQYNKRIQERLGDTVWQSGCQSWYQTESGKNTTLWPGFTFEYWARTRQVRPSDYVYQQASGRSAAKAA